MSSLRISMVQTSLQWENPKSNLEMFSAKLECIEKGIDLIVLPEMFSTGFSMKPEQFAESMEGPSIDWLRLKATQLNCVITGSLIITEKGEYYNRLIWMRPDGTFDHYDKRHLFSLASEENHYTAGSNRLIVELKGFRIMPLICYDLRFPVWSRNDLNYDLVIYVANWPERRSFFWSQLLIARAIENQSFVLGVNRVGNDGNGISHTGDSICLGPLGNPIAQAKPGKEEIVSFEITKGEIESVQNKFKFLNDRDSFELSMD